MPKKPWQKKTKQTEKPDTARSSAPGEARKAARGDEPDTGRGDAWNTGREDEDRTVREPQPPLFERLRTWAKEFRWNRRNVAATAAIVAAVIAVSVLAAQYLGRDPNGYVTRNGITYKTEKTAVLPMSSVKTFNPILSTDQDVYYMSQLIYDGLYTLDENRVPQENLVRSCHIDRSGRKVTLRLISTKFHDGEQLNADDVKYTIDALKESGRSEYQQQVENIDYVAASGSKVTIYYRYGSRISLSDLTFPILPAGQYNGVYDVISRTSFKPVGTGRYKVSRMNTSTGLTLKPNENYHGDKAENTIRFNIMSKSAELFRMTEASNLSMTFTRSHTREEKISQKDTKIVDFPANEVEYLGFNFLDENLSDSSLRRAIAFGIDNSTLIQECWYNCGQLNDNLFYPDYLGVDSSGDSCRYSTAKAERWLGKAGWRDSDDDGWVENKDGSELSLTMVTTGSTERQAMAELITENMENIGIHLTTSTVSDSALESTLKAGNFDLFLAGYRYSDPLDLSEILKGTEYTVTYQYQDDSSADSGSAGSSGSGSDESGGTYSGTDENGTYGGTDENGTYSGTDENGTYSGSDGNGSDTDSGSDESKLVQKKSYSTQITGSNYTRYYSKTVNDCLTQMESGLDNEEMKTQFTKLKKQLNRDLPYYCLLYKTWGVVRAPALQGTVRPTYWNIYNGCETWSSRYEVSSENTENSGTDGSSR